MSPYILEACIKIESNRSKLTVKIKIERSRDQTRTPWRRQQRTDDREEKEQDDPLVSSNGKRFREHARGGGRRCRIPPRHLRG
jgi:hypothetical protein